MAGLAFDGIPSTQTDSSNFSGTNVYATTISGVNYNITGSISDANGRVTSSSTGSPATFGAFIQGGQGGPLLAATGSVVFGRLFSSSAYSLVISPNISGTLPWSVASGTGTYSTSGATVNGQSGLFFNWIAVGT